MALPDLFRVALRDHVETLLLSVQQGTEYRFTIDKVLRLPSDANPALNANPNLVVGVMVMDSEFKLVGASRITETEASVVVTYAIRTSSRYPGVDLDTLVEQLSGDIAKAVTSGPKVPGYPVVWSRGRIEKGWDSLEAYGSMAQIHTYVCRGELGR